MLLTGVLSVCREFGSISEPLTSSVVLVSIAPSSQTIISPRTGPEVDYGNLGIYFPLINRLVTFDSNRQTAPTIFDYATELLLSIYVIRLLQKTRN